MDWNVQIAEYEDHIREAKNAVEAALNAIDGLIDEDVHDSRKTLKFKVLPEIEAELLNIDRLYNP